MYTGPPVQGRLVRLLCYAGRTVLLQGRVHDDVVRHHGLAFSSTVAYLLIPGTMRLFPLLSCVFPCRPDGSRAACLRRSHQSDDQHVMGTDAQDETMCELCYLSSCW
jgi:hypothetical protein